MTNAFAVGQTVYFRPGLAGGVTVTGSSTDGESGVASYAFPALGSGWSGSQAGASYSYSFTNAAVDPVEPNNSTATNNAGLTSSPSSFTVTLDGTAPVSSIACNAGACSGGWYTSTVSVGLSANDGGSGLQEIRFTTDGTDPSPINGTVYSAPFNVLVTTTVKFRAYDRVGNEEAVGSQLVQIDPSAPTGPTLTAAESPSSANQHVSGTTLYYNPQGGNAGTSRSMRPGKRPPVGYPEGHLPGRDRHDRRRGRPTNPYRARTPGRRARPAPEHRRSPRATTPAPPRPPTSRSRPTRPRREARRRRSSAGRTTRAPRSASRPATAATPAPGSNTSSRLVQRASATLSDGACTGGFSSFGGSYSSPDTTVVSGNCYRYRFTIADNVGNVSTAVSRPTRRSTPRRRPRR